MLLASEQSPACFPGFSSWDALTSFVCCLVKPSVGSQLMKK